MAENRMELFIETLTGTAFELSCSPFETIVSIKAKIQYSEGIPVSQQHLIWKSQELSDDLCLRDYSINDGATLKLVLGMKGGPINTRQDTKKIKDFTDLVERNSAGSEGRPLTVLVFHDGDRVHMYYTLIKRGAVSPTISEASSVASVKQEFSQEVANEHEATREKVAQLQEQLKALNISRPKRVLPRLPPIRSAVKTSRCATQSSNVLSLPYIASALPTQNSLVSPAAIKRRLPFTSNLAPRTFIDLEAWLKARPKTSPAKCEEASERKPVVSCKECSPSLSSLGELFSSSVKALKPLNERREDSDTSAMRNLSRQESKLPLIKPKKKSHKRCFQCSRKTGLATSYTCRCGKNFCASHRYAEVHHCSYDYKTEGRRLLQLSNPVVTASKLPKI